LLRARRGDPLAVGLCLGRFVDAVMRLRLLLSGDFTPFWKRLAHEFRRLAGAAAYVPLLEGLLRSGDLEEQAGLTRAICRHVHRELGAAPFRRGSTTTTSSSRG
jgi:hypothetical protein